MKKKQRDLFYLIAGILIILLVNYIGSFVFDRIDLTENNRYTLKEETIELVQDLPDIVYIKVYLKGDLPADIKRLKDATKEMLDDLRAYQSQNIQYEFINPSTASSKEDRRKFYKELKEKGLKETVIQVRKKGSRGEKILFPGATVSYQGKELPIQLLKSQNRMPTPQMINNSINNLEYEITNTIRKLVRGRKPKIALIEGHGELDQMEIADFSKALRENYVVERVPIEEKLDALEDFDAIVIAKPKRAFSDKDKFIIDQFLMKGGKALWLVDAMKTSMDSLNKQETTLAIPYKLNLEDQLFTYGARINKNLLLDQNCAPIGIVTGNYGDRPKVEKHPWYFFPTVIARNAHPISSNLDPVRLKFVSSVDTVGGPGVEKKILLSTSQNTKIMNSPVRISLGIITLDPRFKQSGNPEQPVAVLLEGKFQSVFQGRMPPKITKSKEIGFKERSEETRMIVVGDGDVARNMVDRKQGQVMPLDYSKYARREIYGNKAFLLNAMDYLMGEQGSLSLRSGITLRKLDQEKVEEKRYFWQVFNVSLPLLVIILFGMTQYFLRKKKFGN